MVKNQAIQRVAETPHSAAARRLRCRKCGQHPRQPPWTVCALCRALTGAQAARLGWRRRQRWQEQRRIDRLCSLPGALGEIARAVVSAPNVAVLYRLRDEAAALGKPGAEVRRLAEGRIARLRPVGRNRSTPG